MDAMDAANLAISASANSNASAARDEARRARDASEERLEGGAKFIVISNRFRIEKKSTGLFSSEENLVPAGKVSIKISDIADIRESDDFPGYTMLRMEERCDNYDVLYTRDSIERVTQLING